MGARALALGRPELRVDGVDQAAGSSSTRMMAGSERKYQRPSAPSDDGLNWPHLGVRPAVDCSRLIELEREAPERMGFRMEQCEQIRRDGDREGLWIRGLAVRHGVHRRTVNQPLASPSRRFVSTCGCACAMRWPVDEVFVSQVHAPGIEAEVDWGKALGGHLSVMRASFSSAAFCQASLVETQQAFLELRVQAFGWFGGVFAEIRFDNLKSAVKKVLRGRRRVESDRFVAPRSHSLFASQFTTRGSRGPTRKVAWREKSAASAGTTCCRSRSCVISLS